MNLREELRYFIEIAYLGTVFHGWQSQENAVTVQGELELALSTVMGTKIAIHGSSRTDAGVHARQQFAHLDLPNCIEDIPKLVLRLNRFLHKDISIRGIYPVSDEAHSRFDATGRKYIYRIIHQKDPFLKNCAALYTKVPDMDIMNEACQILFKHIDFQCFSKVKTDVFTYNCEIVEATWIQNGSFLEFHITANRFLRGMVRAIVGTMLDVGYGRCSVEEFEQIIISKDRRRAGMASKAEGLTLENVYYNDRSDILG
jgi:tRNA pseudouridine38-40 synthase